MRFIDKTAIITGASNGITLRLNLAVRAEPEEIAAAIAFLISDDASRWTSTV